RMAHGAGRAYGRPAHLRPTHSSVSSVRNAASVHHDCHSFSSVREVRVAARFVSRSTSSEAFSGRKTLPPLLAAISSRSAKFVVSSSISLFSGGATLNGARSFSGRPSGAGGP